MPLVHRLPSKALAGALTAILSVVFALPLLGQEPDSLDVDYAEQLPRIPPRTVEESLESFQLQNGFRAELVAAEPQVSDPVAIAFDEYGRAFVVEMRGYSEDGEKNLGVVRLLEDRDHDGRYETSSVFVDKLSWPTAIACFNGGVLIGAAPEILFCRDTDGDGRADEKRTVFTGFHRSNVQGLVNSFRWSLDNRIYGAASSSGADVKAAGQPDAEPLSLRRRDFAIEPRTMSISPASGGGQHGQSFDAFGRRFVCSNSNHLQMIYYEDRYLGRNPHQKPPAANVSIAADGPQAPVFRASPVEPWRIVRTRLRVKGIVPGPVEGGGTPAGYFTGATGAIIYQGDAFPPEYHGNAFVADCGSNLVHRKLIEYQGVGAVARRADEKTEFLRSEDIWFRPVQLANAPDGTLYVLDMSREVIEHPKSLPPVIKQHLDLTSGRKQGRIYRIVPENFRQPPPIRLGDASGEELVKTLAHTNGWHRDTAARLIYQRQDRSLVPALTKLAESSESAIGRIRALYALGGLAALDVVTLMPRLEDQHPRVREHAVRLAESRAADSPQLRQRLLALADDPDQRVRYQLAFSLGEFSNPGRVGALATIVRRDPGDSWIRLAVLSSLSDDAAIMFSRLAAEKEFIESDHGRAVLGSLAEQIAAAGRRDEMAVLIDVLVGLNEDRPRLVAGIVQSIAANAADNDSLRSQLAAISSGESGDLLSELIADAKRAARDGESPVDRRVEAIGTLRIAKVSVAAPILGELLDPAQPSAVQTAALATLREFRDQAAARLVIDRFDQLSPAVRGEALETVLARKEWTLHVLDWIAAEEFAAANIDPARRQALREHPDAEIRTRAVKVFGDEASSARSDVLEKYQSALTLKGDADRGRMVFRKTCAACHRLENVGHELGKDLKSVGDRGAGTILSAVIDPNREVDPAYLNYSVSTIKGRVYSGVIVAETAASITLKRANGATDTVPRSEIDVLRSTGKSIMPEGLEKEVSVEEMADLIEYLSN